MKDCTTQPDCLCKDCRFKEALNCSHQALGCLCLGCIHLVGKVPGKDSRKLRERARKFDRERENWETA